MKRQFEKDFIDRVRDSNDIVSVISSYMPLKKKGNNYWGCCPFHNEKTPSFSVTPEKGFYYCFGCRASGNVFKFLMEYKHYSFTEAVEELAKRANIELPLFEQSPEEMAKAKYRQQIYEVNELAAKFFHNCLLQTSMGKEGLDYLQKRGLSEETIRLFRLGFAPDSWDKLYNAFRKKGIDEKLLLDAGLCRKGNNKVYDYFRNRVMFPICDGKGHVVGFGGRVLDGGEPKYLNSQETSIFNKGHLLFAFDKAYKSIREKKQAILVEGYMDVIGAHNRGITNVVASLGTALTKDQVQILVRQATEIVLAYDMDEAGQKATQRAIELTNNMDFKVRVLAMPEGKDPDEFIKKQGPSAFFKLIESAVTPFDYLVNGALIRHDSSQLEGKLAILNELFPFIATVNEPVKRENFLRALALPLWLDNSTVFRYFREYLEKGDITLKNQGPIQVERFTSTQKNIDNLLALALSSPEALERVETYLLHEDYPNPIHGQLLTKASQLCEKSGILSSSALESMLTEEEHIEFSRIMVSSEQISDIESLDGYIRSIRLESLRNQYKENSMMADKLNRAGNPEFIRFLKQCQEIQAEIKKWS